MAAALAIAAVLLAGAAAGEPLGGRESGAAAEPGPLSGMVLASRTGAALVAHLDLNRRIREAGVGPGLGPAVLLGAKAELYDAVELVPEPELDVAL